MIELLYFTCWVQSRYQKSASLAVKIGKRAPIYIRNYYPVTKIHVFDAVNTNCLPLIQIVFNQYAPKIYDLNNYTGHQHEPYEQVTEDFRLLFTFQLLKNTEPLYNKYCKEKSQVQKHYLCEGIKDFIRSQKQFLAQFEKNQQIQQIRVLEAQESKVQRQLCQEIMEVKKYTLETKKIILIVITFLFIGFLLGKHDIREKGNIISNFLYSNNKNNNKKYDRQEEKQQKKKIQPKKKQRKTADQSRQKKNIKK